MSIRALGLAALIVGFTALSVSPSYVRGDDAKKEAPVTPAAAPIVNSGNTDVDEINTMALRLWSAAQGQTGEGNLVWLPTVTVKSVSVLGLASSGTAKKELETTFPLLGKKREKEVGAILSAVGDDKLQFTNVAALWVGAGTKVRPTIVKQFDESFGIKTFGTPKESPADKVNAWLSAQTGGKVKTGVSSETFKDNPAFVLTSAAAIKGSWSKSFDTTYTGEGDFTLADGKTKAKVKFMRKQAEFASFEVTDGTAVAIPVAGDATGFYVLPKDGKSVGDVVNGLSADTIRQMRDNAGKAELKKRGSVTLPVFKTESKIDFKKAAMELGVKKAFDAKPSPSDLSLEELTPADVYVAEWAQKSTHSFDEGGFEGTALEVVTVRSRGAGPASDFTFDANRPHLFIVIDKQGLIVDLVRTENPTK